MSNGKQVECRGPLSKQANRFSQHEIPLCILCRWDCLTSIPRSCGAEMVDILSYLRCKEWQICDSFHKGNQIQYYLSLSCGNGGYFGLFMSYRMANLWLSIKETKSKSCVSFKLDMNGQCKGIESFIDNLNLPPYLRSSLSAASRFLLKDGNSQSQPQPEAVVSPVSYRSSCRHRQRKHLLL